MRFNLILFIIFYSYFICPSLSFAARPLSTDDAGVVDKGHFEMEGSLEYTNQLDKEVALCLVVKGGIFDNMDLGIEIPYKFIDFGQGTKTDGFDDIKIISKYNFLVEEKTLPAMSVSLSVKTDSGNDDKSLGTGEKEYAVNAILSKSLNNLTLHFNLGYVIKDNLPEQNLRDILTYGFAIEYAVNERFNFVGEITGENERRGDFDDNLTSGLVGFNYAINENISYDLGLAFEISEASPDFKVTTGFSFSL